MKKIFFFLMVFIFNSYSAILENLQSFEADFSQTIDDDENKVVTYYGHIVAAKPQYAKWDYTKPIKKSVYINNYLVTIVEPELEQAIFRKIKDDFNIFTLLKNAKKIDTNKYKTTYKDTDFIITYDGKNILSLQYHDNFDNLVTIKFSNQKYNINIEKKIFKALIPNDYDIITQ